MVVLNGYLFLNIVIGLLTPPLGVCLFVVCSLSRISIERLVRAIMPFLLVEIGILFLVSYFPITALLIPKLLGYLGQHTDKEAIEVEATT
jgi:TRAP-type C4-dicarboxylate transport system permease large subunit